MEDIQNATKFLDRLSREARGMKLADSLCSIAHYAEYHRDALEIASKEIAELEKGLELARKDNLAVSRECVQLRKILSENGIN